MAETLVSMLGQLQAALEELRERERTLSERNLELEAENAELRRRAEEALSERDRARMDAEFLTVSHRLADNPDTLVEARRHIARLIRNIDRCMEMLKE